MVFIYFVDFGLSSGIFLYIEFWIESPIFRKEISVLKNLLKIEK